MSSGSVQVQFPKDRGRIKAFQALKSVWRTDTGALILVCLTWLILLILVTILSSAETGFHRDELGFLDNARFLDWGYVEYPPLTPFIARLALSLFGLSLVGLRLFSELAVCATMLISGLMTLELGGTRRAQILTALIVGTAPIVLFNTNFFSYQTFDFLWWVLAAYAMLRLLKSENPRWWLLIGAAIGLGMMTKYTTAFWVAGLAAGVIFTPARRHLKSPWLWAGAGVALLICLPNLIWQAQHNFISLKFLSEIHARDVRLGRTSDYLIAQLYVCVNAASLFLWANGLRFYWFMPAGRAYRPLGWMAVVPFLLFLLTQGRFYYMAPAYPMLVAAGCCLFEHWQAGLPERKRKITLGLQYGSLALLGLVMMALMLPLAPVNSGWWKLTADVNGEVREKFGWTDLAGSIAGIRDGLQVEDQAQLGILAGNYGEAAALNLYGPAYQLPQAISLINSYWLRGYGDPPPQVLIVVGLPLDYVYRAFESCTLAGHVTNRYGILNEETRDHPDIYVCRKLIRPWPDLWKSYQYFG